MSSNKHILMLLLSLALLYVVKCEVEGFRRLDEDDVSEDED